MSAELKELIFVYKPSGNKWLQQLASTVGPQYVRYDPSNCCNLLSMEVVRTVREALNFCRRKTGVVRP